MHLYSKVKTDLGDFRIACSPLGITAIRPAEESSEAFESAYESRVGIRPRPGHIPEEYGRALQAAVAGQTPPSAPIDWSGFTQFRKKVLECLQKVPAGEIRTYSWLAHRAGRPKAARAVGNAMAHNPIPILIPCHRIVPAAGGIGNYGLGRKLKRDLLEREGIVAEKIDKLRQQTPEP